MLSVYVPAGTPRIFRDFLVYRALYPSCASNAMLTNSIVIVLEVQALPSIVRCILFHSYLLISELHPWHDSLVYLLLGQKSCFFGIRWIL